MGSKTLLNVVHPYTYKQDGGTFFQDPIEKFKDRNENASSLIKGSLDNGVDILWHQFFNHPKTYALHLATLYDYGFYSCLYDDRIDHVITPKTGTPIPDKNNGKNSAEVWDFLTKVFTSNSELREKVEGYDNFLFIGGFLEACLTNCMEHFSREYVENGEKLYWKFKNYYT